MLRQSTTSPTSKTSFGNASLQWCAVGPPLLRCYCASVQVLMCFVVESWLLSPFTLSLSGDFRPLQVGVASNLYSWDDIDVRHSQITYTGDDGVSPGRGSGRRVRFRLPFNWEVSAQSKHDRTRPTVGQTDALQPALPLLTDRVLLSLYWRRSWRRSTCTWARLSQTLMK